MSAREGAEREIHPTAELYLYAYGEAENVESVVLHLAGCASCRSVLAELTATREAAARLPDVDLPDARWRELVSDARERVTAASSRDGWTQRARRAALPALAAAAVTAAVAMHLLDARRDEIASLARELREERARTAIALLRLPRSADRLRGVSSGSALLDADARVTSAFTHALRHDPSPNVRLAVLDAIDAMPRRTRLVTELLAALPDERLASVRLAMIDLVAKLDDARGRDALARVAATDPDATVRARARAAVAGFGAGKSRAQ